MYISPIHEPIASNHALFELQMIEIQAENQFNTNRACSISVPLFGETQEEETQLSSGVWCGLSARRKRKREITGGTTVGWQGRRDTAMAQFRYRHPLRLSWCRQLGEGCQWSVRDLMTGDDKEERRREAGKVASQGGRWWVIGVELALKSVYYVKSM